MVSIKAVYNGKEFIPLEDFPRGKKYNVVITFMDELKEGEESREFASQSNAFDFWKVKEQDLYQDYLTKK
ncbi:MAG: hypothetical protein PHP42_11605 [Bacteroidota bacterium]|nr:hypothetical protein [Bacteroidota bacterium]